MQLSNAFWQLFIMSGHVGAYLLYKDYAHDEVAEDDIPDDTDGEHPWSTVIGNL